MGEVVVPRLAGRQMWKDAFDMHVVNAGTEHSAKPSTLLSISHFPEWAGSGSALGACPDPQSTDLCTQLVLKNVPSLE